MNATLEPPARGIVNRYAESDTLPDPDASPAPVEARAPGRRAVAPPTPNAPVFETFSAPEPATSAVPLPPLRTPGNSFGSAWWMGVEPANITTGQVARRFRAELLAVIDLAELRTAAAAIAKQRAIQTEHSSPVRARKILRLSEIYATNPTEVNRLALQAAKTISESDAVLVSQLAQSRIAETLRSIWPALNRLAIRAAELLEQEARTIWASEHGYLSTWGIPPVPSSLTQGLRVLSQSNANLTKAKVPPGDLSELAAALLEVTKDLPSQSATQ